MSPALVDAAASALVMHASYVLVSPSIETIFLESGIGLRVFLALKKFFIPRRASLHV
jgi:hypothetical protein